MFVYTLFVGIFFPQHARLCEEFIKFCGNPRAGQDPIVHVVLERVMCLGGTSLQCSPTLAACDISGNVVRPRHQQLLKRHSNVQPSLSAECLEDSVQGWP